MSESANIVIGDQTALHLLLHSDIGKRMRESLAGIDPLEHCATSIEEMRAFNQANPLYGDGPSTLLVRDYSSRKHTKDILCRLARDKYPPGSFFMLRSGLYVTTPELLFVRMAGFLNRNQLVEVGMNLCASYYIDTATGELPDRTEMLTTPERLLAYAENTGIRGSDKAIDALRFVLPGSKSPFETKVKIQYCHPLRLGGMALPFNVMNHDVTPKNMRRIVDQNWYSIDIADTNHQVGLEYDGEFSHQDPSRDKRRLNELKALGWDVFPIDWQVLRDPNATIQVAEQIAHRLHLRIRYPKSWIEQFPRLREDLGLPTIGWRPEFKCHDE